MTARGRVAALFVLVGVVLAAPLARAHGGDTTYIVLTPSGATLEGSANFDLVDVEGIVQVPRQDLILGRHRDKVAAYLAKNLTLSDGTGPCPIESSTDTMEFDSNLRLSFKFVARCAHVVERIDVGFHIFFDAAVYYLGIVRLEGASHETQMFTSGHRTGTFVLPSAAGAGGAVDTKARAPDAGGSWSLRGLLSSVRAGALHIWSGADHILFLLALLMTSVVVRAPGGWAPRPDLRASLVDVAKIVTGFTVTHSVTLSLAALGLLTPAPRVIEPAIAASVAVAALDNVRPLPFLNGKKWGLASTLGLLHGFGFASGLNELVMPKGSLLETLVGFALGVELGQAIFVSAFVPAAFALRKTTLYRRWVIPGGSTAIAALALVWMVQRALPR
jgi:hypothetical protein